MWSMLTLVTTATRPSAMFVASHRAAKPDLDDRGVDGDVREPAERDAGEDLEVAGHLGQVRLDGRDAARGARRACLVVDRVAVPRDPLVDPTSRSGLVYAPTESPLATQQRRGEARRARSCRWCPSRARPGTRAGASRAARASAAMRARVGRAARRGVPTGTPSASRLTCASSQARASSGRTVSSGRARRARPRSTPAARRAARGPGPGPLLARRRAAARSSASRVGSSRTTTRSDLGAQRPLLLGLGLADRAEHLGGHLEHRRVPVAGGAPGAAPSPARRPGGPCPSRHHDHTSSVTNGRCGAKRRSSVVEGDHERRPGRGGAGVAHRAVGPLLDELDVVVAEPPEEPLGVVERPGVVEGLERGGRRRRRGWQGRRAGPGRAARSPRPGRGRRRRARRRRPTPRVNFEALRILMARRRPIFIWPSSKVVSVPGCPRAAQ